MFPATPNWFDQLINFNVTWNVVWPLHIFHLAATTVYWYHLEYERYFFLGHVVFWRMLFMRALSTIIPPFSFHSIPPYFHHYFLNWENYCSICIYIYILYERKRNTSHEINTHIYIYILSRSRTISVPSLFLNLPSPSCISYPLEEICLTTCLLDCRW